MSVPFITTTGPIATISNLLGSMRRLEKEQWLSAEELAARRRSRLRQVVAHAAAGALLRPRCCARPGSRTRGPSSSVTSRASRCSTDR